jgi:membrane protease subunit HflC
MNKLWLCALLFLSLLISSSLVIVEEGQRGIVFRFDEAQRDDQQQVRILQPGLQFKLPVIERIKLLDARIQMMESHEGRFITAEKKDLIVDSYVKWRIKDFGKYFAATQNGELRRAQGLIKDKVSDRLRSEMGNRTIKDIVSGSRGELMEEVRNSLNSGPNSMMEEGIEVVDVRIKQINLPTEVSSSIYQRMQAERLAVASEHRSQGKEQAAIILADVNRRITVMLAEAERKAQRLRGEGDATVAQLFTEAFGQHLEFYRLVRRLKGYEESFSSQDLWVLRPGDVDYLRYLSSPTEGRLKQGTQRQN